MRTNYRAPHHVLLSCLLPFQPSEVQILKIQGTFTLNVQLQQESMALNGKMEDKVLLQLATYSKGKYNTSFCGLVESSYEQLCMSCSVTIMCK